MNKLYEKINAQKEVIDSKKIEIPEYISENLKYSFFDWQKEAFENFIIYENFHKKKPTHLMFNMATGTGKTLVMASMLLYYYKKGYRNFIFFVNQNNIVDKTENNFIDSSHGKYLFKDSILIDNKIISIKKVENFSDNSDDIEIKFTTIQKLYNDIHVERENQTTREDLISRNIVMLADEAHHLNADTKKIKQESLDISELKDTTNKDIIEKKGWEHTVIELILNKSGASDNKNVLLEFTATIPNDDSVKKKYSDKIVYKFDLKEFLSAGYTKEINLISSTLKKKDRTLHALLFNWYRHKIALENNIGNFKSVVLFRSKTIEESQDDFEEFLNFTKNIKDGDFDFLINIEEKINNDKGLHEQGKSRTRDVLQYIKKNKIEYSVISKFIQENFQERNCIITNSKTNTTKKEKTDADQEALLNNLEDKSNHIRAIFTVERLTEGWDVLNLFDIVRLYEGQNAGGSDKKTAEATTKEKQLIGRGVRYFPFNYKDKQKNKRKFDDDLKNELRVLEELFYYTYDQKSRYITDLKNALREAGYISDKDIRTFSLKENFKNTDFYKTVKVWHNEQIKNPDRVKNDLKSIKSNFKFEYYTSGLEMLEEEMNLEEERDTQRLALRERGLGTISKNLSHFDKNITRKALNIKSQNHESLYRFDNLVEKLNVKEISDIFKKDFLGDLTIDIIVNNNQKFEDLSQKEKLDILLKFFEKIESEMDSFIHPNVGTDFKESSFSEIFNNPKIKAISESTESQNLSEELENEDWYILDSFVGTSEEVDLIKFIQSKIGNLENKYNKYYLLRNEEVYKIYDFEQGRGFQPDFLLFMEGKKSMYYQLFIEPKGNQFLGEDRTFSTGKESWKVKFLKEISEKYGDSEILKADSKKYQLYGVPFYNKEHNSEFEEIFNKFL